MFFSCVALFFSFVKKRLRPKFKSKSVSKKKTFFRRFFFSLRGPTSQPTLQQALYWLPKVMSSTAPPTTTEPSTAPSAAPAAAALVNGLTAEERFRLLLSVGEECIAPEELQRMVQNKPSIRCYDGFEPSGRLHIAQGIFKAINVNKCTTAGCVFTFWVADWFALMNDKMGGELERINQTLLRSPRLQKFHQQELPLR